MKPPAEAFIREYFHVTMFSGEHLHVLYTPNEKRKKKKSLIDTLSSSSFSRTTLKLRIFDYKWIFSCCLEAKTYVS